MRLESKYVFIFLICLVILITTFYFSGVTAAVQRDPYLPIIYNEATQPRAPTPTPTAPSPTSTVLPPSFTSTPTRTMTSPYILISATPSATYTPTPTLTPTYTPPPPPDIQCSDVTEIPQIECEALVALYNNTTGAGWTNHTNWLVTITPSIWYGVTVTSGHVMSLYLSSNQLRGTITPELGNLTNLEILRLNDNKLKGNIPDTLFNLINLLNPGMASDGGDGLDLDYNHLNVPAGYPDPNDPLQVFLSQKDADWHLRQTIVQSIFLPFIGR